MKREFAVCDSCEQIISTGGLRLVVAEDPDQTIDLCPGCLVEVLPLYAERSRKDVLTANISAADFHFLMDDADDTEPADTVVSMMEDEGGEFLTGSCEASRTNQTSRWSWVEVPEYP